MKAKRTKSSTGTPAPGKRLLQTQQPATGIEGKPPRGRLLEDVSKSQLGATDRKGTLASTVTGGDT